MNRNRKKVAFHTLGCKLNFAETSTISRSFPEDKFEKVPASSEADIYVINTCSVTDAADRKCRQTIRKFIARSPGAFIAVVGCYAQLKPQEISSIPGVDLVLGTNEKFDLAEYMEVRAKKPGAEIHSCKPVTDAAFNNSYSVGDRTRSFLKVQDGCDYNCSYCTIPLARGHSRNPRISGLMEEARKIAARGVKEIVLTGVNIGDFGRSTGESFFDLLSALVRIPEIERYRISSIEPNLLSDRIIDLASENGKILPHFHIPLQSGCDRILNLMRRRYTREMFRERIDKIRDCIPLAGLGADIIAGFPGESDPDFEETFSFLSDLHVFTYSERPGTVAGNLPQKVKPEMKAERTRRLMDLSEQKALQFSKLNLFTETYVLFENSRISGMVTGFSSNYIRVEHPWQPGLAGKIKKVKLTGIASSGRMCAEITEDI